MRQKTTFIIFSTWCQTLVPIETSNMFIKIIDIVPWVPRRTLGRMGWRGPLSGLRRRAWGWTWWRSSSSGGRQLGTPAPGTWPAAGCWSRPPAPAGSWGHIRSQTRNILHSLKIIGVIFLCHRQFQTLKTQMFLKFVPELLTLVE